MTALRIVLSRIADLLLRRRREARLDDEVQAHLDFLTDEHIARGMAPEDARLAARKAFGGVDQVKSVYRDQRGLPFVDALWQDARFAARVLARDRGFTLTAVLVLGLGIGVNNVFFTLAYAHTMRGLPMPRPDRVLYISTFDDRVPDRPVSRLDFNDLRAMQRSFTGLAAFATAPVTIGDDGRVPDRFDGGYVTANAFDLVGSAPLLGRSFGAEDDRPGAAPVLILSTTAWRSRYGSDPSILGRTVLLNGSPVTVVGIMPDRSGVPSTSTVWIPLAQMPGIDDQARDARSLRVFGRLRDGVAEVDARADIEAIAGRLAETYPGTNRNLRARVVPINERFLGRLEGPWLAFIVAGCIIVLISAANVANLILSRTVHRAGEIAIRTSLGASRLRLVRQLLIEGAVLAILGGAAGLVVSLAGVRLFRSLIPENVLPYWNDYTMDTGAFAALVVASFVTVFIFALVPAIQASRTDVNAVLKDGGRAITSSRSRRWTTAFLTAQLALAVILLAQVGVESLASQTGIPSDAAIDTPQVLTASVTLPAARYPSSQERHAFYRQLDERLRSVGGITSASVASSLPGTGAVDRQLEIAGRTPAAGATPTTAVVDIGPGYFETLALPMVRGRTLTETDGGPGQANVVVNARFVEMFLDGEEALGTRIALTAPGAASGPPEWMTIVGIAPVIRQHAGGREPAPVVYVPLASTAPATSVLMVRSAADTASLATILRDEVHAVDPNVPLYRMQTLARAVYDAGWNPRVSARLAAAVTLLSVLLATVGLYAITAHGVSLRTQEIGLRMALGARAPHLVLLVMRSVRTPLVLGFLLGMLGATAWDRAFASARPGLRLVDPTVLALVGIMVSIVTLIACFVPARRAARLDPVAALREE